MLDLSSVSYDALLQSTYQSLLDSQQYYSWRILELLYYLLYFFQRAAVDLRLTQLEKHNNRRFKVYWIKNQIYKSGGLAGQANESHVQLTGCQTVY